MSPKTKGRALSWHIDGLTYAECRGIEQLGMWYYHTLNKGNKLYNQINGISLWNNNRDTYLLHGMRFLLTTMKYSTYAFAPTGEEWYDVYLANIIENERLNGGL